MNDLSSLIERVTAATGPDRVLDLYIDMAARGLTLVGGWEAEDASGVRVKLTGVTPEYTASFDSSLALAERKFPGVWWHIAKGRSRPDEPLYGIVLLREGTEDDVLGEAEHECLQHAIILALLRALQSSHPATASGIVERESGEAQ